MTKEELAIRIAGLLEGDPETVIVSVTVLESEPNVVAVETDGGEFFVEVQDA